MTLRGTDFIIGDQTPMQVATPGTFSRGLVPRDYSRYPSGCYASAPRATDLQLIPRDQWIERIKEKVATESQLSNIRRRSGINGGRIISLDQDGIGYCWNHSVAMCVIMLRAVMGQPYVRLSPFMVGCLIKQYRDEGGWAAQALDFIMANGIPSEEFWAAKSMNRSNDTAAMRENAKSHIVTEGWMDMSASIYNRNLTEDESMTCLLLNIPVAGDFNWWGHSVCLLDAVIANENIVSDFGSLDLNDARDLQAYAAAFGKRGINSWTDSYGDLGEFVLTGSRAILDGGVAPRVTAATAA